MSSKPSRWTEHAAKRALQCAERGESCAATAKRYGTSPGRLTKVLKAHFGVTWIEARQRAEAGEPVSVTREDEAVEISLASASNDPLRTRWFVGHCEPQRETITATNLMRRGYRAWAPYFLAERRYGQSTKLVRRPVFPRYTFIGVMGGQTIHEAQRTPYVCDVISFGDGDPVPIPPSMMERLMRKCDADGLMVDANERQPSDKLWKVGDFVQINDGSPLSGLIVRIAAIDGAGVLEVEAEIFQAARKVKVPPERVQATQVASP